MRHLRSLFAVLLFAVGAAAACGGTSTDTTCESACDRSASCAIIPSADVGSCKAACSSDLTPACSNQSAIDSCQNGCIAKSDCASYQTCIAGCPACAK